jgi:hypothetical protein
MARYSGEHGRVLPINPAGQGDHYNMRRAIGLISLGIASLLVVPGTAAAGGGASIASAPVVAYGQQEFGNTATDGGTNPGSLNLEQQCSHTGNNGWWNLPVVAGDAVTIDWEAPAESYAMAFPVGTTDFNVLGEQAVEHATVSSNGKDAMWFRATVSGTMPLVIGAGGCFTTITGPYSFTASVKHEVRLSIPHRRVLPLRGTVAVHVSTPEGQPISDSGLQVLVQIQSHGHWRGIGSASAAAGVANVPCTVPAGLSGSHANLRAIARGNEYEPAASASVRVRVA